MSEAKKSKNVSQWSKDDSSVRVIPASISPADQTAIDAIKASDLPRATKASAIEAIQNKASAESIHLVRHTDASVLPLVTIGKMRRGIAVDHVKTIIDNAEFIAAYLDEQM